VPAGDYTIRLLDVPADQVTYERKLTRRSMMQMRLCQVELRAFWDGSIEGKVRDAAGGPALVLMELRNPDGTELDPDASHSVAQGRDGLFRVENLPIGGRYLLLLNPVGPSQDSPYPFLYYPSAASSHEARVFEIKAGDPHIGNINFTVGRLVERTLPVRVKWADGRPMEGAEIHIAYEHTGSWEALVSAPRYWNTDGNGNAEIHVFGDSRVRVFAEHFPRYSAVVEMDTAKLSGGVDLVVSSAELRLGR
jgi:hypothetical protein